MSFIDAEIKSAKSAEKVSYFDSNNNNNGNKKRVISVDRVKLLGDIVIPKYHSSFETTDEDEEYDEVFYPSPKRRRKITPDYALICATLSEESKKYFSENPIENGRRMIRKSVIRNLDAEFEEIANSSNSTEKFSEWQIGSFGNEEDGTGLYDSAQL